MKSNNSAVLMRILTVPSQLRTHTWNIKTVCTNKLKKYFPLLSLASSGRFLERIIAIYRGSDMLFLSLAVLRPEICIFVVELVVGVF